MGTGYGKTMVKIIKAVGIILLVLSLLMFIGTAVMGAATSGELTKYRNVVENGKSTIARITDCADKPFMKTSINGKETRYYKAEIEYYVGEELYEAEDVTVTKREIGMGGIEIFYLPDEPEKPVTEYDTESIGTIIFAAVCGGVGLVFFIVSIVLLIGARVRKKKLIKAGAYAQTYVNGPANGYQPYPQYPRYPGQGYQQNPQYPQYPGQAQQNPQYPQQGCQQNQQYTQYPQHGYQQNPQYPQYPQQGYQQNPQYPQYPQQAPQNPQQNSQQ